MKTFTSLGTYFKTQWKLLTFISLFWTIVIATMFFALFFSPAFSIGDGSLNETKESGNAWTTHTVEMIPIGMLYNMWFKNFGFALYGFFMVIFINRILLKEINTNQITIWLTQPLSKTQIIISKYLFLLICLTITYIPSFIVLIIVSSYAYDAKEHLTNMIQGGVQTYIFLIMLSMILFTIALLLADKITMFNVISAIIMTYFILIGLLEILVLITQTKNVLVHFLIKYIGLQVFITNVLNYDWDADQITKIVESQVSSSGAKTQLYFQLTVIKDINKLAYWLSTAAMVVITILLGYASIWLFKSKSFSN